MFLLERDGQPTVVLLVVCVVAPVLVLGLIAAWAVASGSTGTGCLLPARRVELGLAPLTPASPGRAAPLLTLPGTSWC
jgi:hypothetical protein